MESLAGIWNVVIHTFIGDQFSEHELYVEPHPMPWEVLNLKEKDKNVLCNP